MSPKHLAKRASAAGFTWTALALDPNARVMVPWAQVARRGPDGKASTSVDTIAMHLMVNELRDWDIGLRAALAAHKQIPPVPDGCRLQANAE
jgi:hypothetical protein